MAMIISPSIITVIDSKIDISMFYGVAEENEEKSNEKNIEIESLFFEVFDKEQTLILNCKKNKNSYIFKKYPKPHLNLVFPPPDISFS